MTTAANADIARFSPFDSVTNVADEAITSNAEPPRKGGTLRSGTLRTFDTLNPIPFPAIYPVRIGYMFDSLLVPSTTEPAVYYGLLAQSIEVAPDFSSVRFKIDPRARWHDGTPITPEDIRFTFELARDLGFPSDREAFATVEAKIEPPASIAFRNSTPGSWRWIAQLDRMNIQSKDYWSTRDPSHATMKPPLGSGPYRVSEVRRNRRFSLVRAAGYWAADHALNSLRWNFDQLVVDYYAEKFTLMAALKRGDIDVVLEADPGDWREGYQGPALWSGDLTRSAIPSRNGGNLQLLVFNLRRPMLQDQLLRRAISQAFDPSWYVDLFGGTYYAPGSYYAGTRLSATGPASDTEKAVLGPFLEDLPDGIIATPGPDMGRDDPDRRERSRRANTLLDDAGYRIVNGRRVHPDTGTPISLTLVTSNADLAGSLLPFETWLDRIGIDLAISMQDPVKTRQLIFDHAFDLTPFTWRPDDPPGRLESFIWYSGFADDAGFGLAGLKSDAADHLIGDMRSSTKENDIVAAARAFDRYMQWSQYALPMWQESDVWFVHKSGLAFPKAVDPARLPDEFWWWAE